MQLQGNTSEAEQTHLSDLDEEKQKNKELVAKVKDIQSQSTGKDAMIMDLRSEIDRLRAQLCQQTN